MDIESASEKLLVMKSIGLLVLVATAVFGQNAPIPAKPGLYATFDTSKGTIDTNPTLRYASRPRNGVYR